MMCNLWHNTAMNLCSVLQVKTYPSIDLIRFVTFINVLTIRPPTLLRAVYCTSFIIIVYVISSCLNSFKCSVSFAFSIWRTIVLSSYCGFHLFYLFSLHVRTTVAEWNSVSFLRMGLSGQILGLTKWQKMDPSYTIFLIPCISYIL